jgi:hypothetical protein
MSYILSNLCKFLILHILLNILDKRSILTHQLLKFFMFYRSFFYPYRTVLA